MTLCLTRKLLQEADFPGVHRLSQDIPHHNNHDLAEIYFNKINLKNAFAPDLFIEKLRSFTTVQVC